MSLTLENPDPARYRISPGMSCTITMLSADPVPDAVSLPVSAVYAPAGGGTYVWIVGAGDRVMRREVTLGELFGRDRVVVDSVSRRRTGRHGGRLPAARGRTGPDLKLTPP